MSDKAGRPRSQKARRAILRAARELLAERGLTGVTVEGIAERARVGKPTIYRAWPNAMAVVMAALIEEDELSPDATRELRGLDALRRQLRKVSALFATPLGRNITLMVAASDDSTELARVFRNHFILARREEGRRYVQQAVDDGELRADIDLDTALDLIYAPIFYRLLGGHQPLSDSFTDAALAHLLTGLLARP